jgi:hypothetical protein
LKDFTLIFYVILAAPVEVIQSALKGIVLTTTHLGQNSVIRLPADPSIPTASPFKNGSRFEPIGSYSVQLAQKRFVPQARRCEISDPTASLAAS